MDCGELQYLFPQPYVMLFCSVDTDREKDITGLIQLWQAGDRSAESRLFELVLPDLRRIAGNEKPRAWRGVLYLKRCIGD